MDIEFVKPVAVKAGEVRSSGSSRRLSERRHTTEVHLDQLPSHNVSELERDSITSLSSEDLSPRGDDYYHPVAGYHDRLGVSGGKNSTTLTNGSWGDLNPSNAYFCGSQGDVYTELNEEPHLPREEEESHERAGQQYPLSYNRALDNVLPSFSADTALTLSAGKKSKQSQTSHVVAEMITTETTYVSDLSEVVEGYLMPVQMRAMSDQVERLFGNISEIREFHSALLQVLNSSANNITHIGQCFLEKVEGFKKLYTQYCNNYPNSIRIYAELSKLPELSGVLKQCQKRLNHALPLGAYLLKPVQRVLKYSLLLSELVKSLSDGNTGYDIVKEAMVEMTEVAEHINAMKKKYDTAVHVQEIQSLMRGHETLDLSKYGDLMLEDSLRFSAGRGTSSTFRGRAERFVFLFQRLYLVTKKEEDGYQYKMHVEMKDLQLTERVEKEPNSYQIRQVSSGRAYTFQTRSLHLKDEWVKKIKILLVESIPHLPDKAKELIMKGFEFPQEMSPSRERQRHVFGSAKSASLGRNSSPQMLHLNKHSSGRSSTSPVPLPLQGTPLQGSMTSRMIGSMIHQPSLLHPKSESPRGSPDRGRSQPHPLHLAGDQGDSGYSDTGEKEKGDQSDATPTQEITPPSDEDPSDHMISAHPNSEPIPDHMTSQENRVDHANEDDHTHNGDHAHEVVTDEIETLFNDIMNNSSNQLTKNTSSSNLDWGARQDDDIITNGDRHVVLDSSHCPTHLPHKEGDDYVAESVGLSSRGSSMDDESVTPRASPFTSPSSIRRWSIKKRRSYDMDPDESSTPKASPYIRRHQSANNHGYMDDTLTSSCSSDVFSPSDTPTSYNNPAPAPLFETILLLPSPDEALEVGGDLSVCPEGQDSERGGGGDGGGSITSSSGGGDGTSGSGGDASTTNVSGSGEVSSISSGGISTTSTSGYRDGGGRSPIIPVLEIKKDQPSSKYKTLPTSHTQRSPTPSTSKTTFRSHKTTHPSASVRRSQSFGNSSKFYVHHNREGSLSTDNSPLPSPIFKTKKGRRKSRDHTSHSPSSASRVSLNGGKKQHSPVPAPPPFVSVMGLISTTRLEPDLEDVPLHPVNQEREGGVALQGHMDTLLPPPEDFEGSHDVRNTSLPRDVMFGEDDLVKGGGGGGGGGRGGDDSRSLLSFFGFNRSKKSSRASTPSDLGTSDDRRVEDDSSTLTTPLATPSGTNENEVMSLDEIMDCFDHYASETGKTTRTNRLDSATKIQSPFTPEVKRKKEKKKKKRHGHTVANIDAETMKEVKRMAAEREGEEGGGGGGGGGGKKDTRVNKLAREYSQRIKDKSKISKRYSTAIDQPSPLATSSLNPNWNEDLKGKRQSRTLLPRPLSNDDIVSSYSQLDEEKASRRVHTLSRYNEDGGLYQEFEGDEMEKRGKFKGWVKSIAAKFGKKEGTTL